MTKSAPTSELQELAKRHLWMHFTRMGAYDDVNPGHGRTEIGDAMAAQVAELDFITVWSYAHPRAIELAGRIASLTPGDLNRVFFTSGGSEAVESAIKLVRAYHQRTGNPRKTKFLTREIAYHGTTLGALQG